MSRRLLLVAACLLMHGPLGADEAAPERPPNVVLIFTDDQGYADVGCFGGTDLQTPRLDEMAREGARLTDFYSAAPVCSASRAALLTGCYPARVGITGVLFPRHRFGLHPDELTIADLLQQHGYATACIGKWHLGHRAPFLPTSQGFDYYFGIPYSNDMTIDLDMPMADDAEWREGFSLESLRNNPLPRHAVPLMCNDQVIEFPADQTTLTRRYTEEAVKFIHEHRDQPFFLYLPHTMPHIPLFTSEQFAGRHGPRGIYGDVIAEIDWSVGQILDALHDEDLDQRTLVIFTSDNGPWLAMGDQGGRATPLRDGKFTTYEGGMRVPCIMRWPAHIPAGSEFGNVASTIDLLPTIAEACHIQLPEH